QKIAAGEEGNYRMERVPLKQTDRHHKSPGGDLCIRDRRWRGEDKGFATQESAEKKPAIRRGGQWSDNIKVLSTI
ncbi:hypothetical protein U0A60_05940, partial [Escherichia coli]|nr:hypothetical protein [Escherichia coli]